MKTQYFKPFLWDISQKIFGADKEKGQLYLECLELKEDTNTPIRLLDFGCATGNVSWAFKGLDYTGIDIDSALIEFACFKYRKYPGLRFISADIFEYQPEKPFEKILFAGVAHHLDDDLLRRVLLKLKTLLTKNGSIYFIDPVITGNEGKVLSLLMSLDQGKFHRRSKTYFEIFAKIGLQTISNETYQAKGTLFPQPLYSIFKLS